jgi:hypothetical protein
MAAITEPLAAAIIVFFIGAAAIWLFEYAGFESYEMENKMVSRLLLGPLCLAVLILLLDGVANHLRLVW